MVSGTGHAGMEAAVANLLEPGEKIIVGVNGIWGERVSDLAERYGGGPPSDRCYTRTSVHPLIESLKEQVAAQLHIKYCSVLSMIVLS